ncbi:MAG TPA: YceI family protein [Candidatus Limnocylindrales bacterium]|nr:YceI family protein [Candidatus Limnocylindrales bacterium]
MPRSRPFLAGAAVLAVAVLIGAYVAYDQVLSGDSVAPLTLPSNSPASADPSASTGDGTTSPAVPAASFDGDVTGDWSVAGGSLAGYRVRERLASLSAESGAVGRTSDVSGSITIESDGTTITLTGGTLMVDTTTIASDEARRDNRLRTEGLQTEQFPTATFTVTEPVEIPAAAVAGTAADLALIGDLTLHGVTKPVSIPVQAQLVDGTIQVAGSITFPLADFDIVAPNVGGFIISIADEGTLEFQVNLTKG